METLQPPELAKVPGHYKASKSSVPVPPKRKSTSKKAPKKK